MQYLWERRSGAPRAEALPVNPPAQAPMTPGPVRHSHPEPSPTSSTVSSNSAASRRRAPPRRPSRRDQPCLFEDQPYQSVFEWDSEEDDAYDRRVAKVRLWNKMSIRRSDSPEQSLGSHHYSANRVDSVRGDRPDAGRDRDVSEPNSKAHVSRLSSLSSGLKRSSSSASRLTQLRTRRTSVIGYEPSRESMSPSDEEGTWGKKHDSSSSFSARMAHSAVQRPPGNFF